MFPFLLMTGMHTAFMPYILNSFATLGCEAIFFTSSIIFNLNQGIACLAVALRSKNKEIKSTAVSSAVTAIVGGITEPAMYGINLKYKKPMIGAAIGSFFGTCVAGYGKATAYAFAGSGGIFGLPIYISDNIANLLWMIGGCVLGSMITFIVTCILYNDEAH